MKTPTSSFQIRIVQNGWIVTERWLNGNNVETQDFVFLDHITMIDFLFRYLIYDPNRLMGDSDGNDTDTNVAVD